MSAESRSAATTPAPCDHVWVWLERPVYRFGTLGQLTDADNVECIKCGARTWAHGRGTNVLAANIGRNPRQEGANRGTHGQAGQA